QPRTANKLTVGYSMRQEERGDRYDSPPPRRWRRHRPSRQSRDPPPSRRMAVRPHRAFLLAARTYHAAGLLPIPMPSLPGNRHRPDPVERFGAALVFVPIGGTPDHEPSRRRPGRFPDVRKQTDCTDGSKYDVKKPRIAPAWKVRSFWSSFPLF